MSDQGALFDDGSALKPWQGGPPVGAPGEADQGIGPRPAPPVPVEPLDPVAEAARLAHEQTIQEAFERFHASNPRVYELLCRFARELRRAGHDHGGIGMIWERMRWEVVTGSSDDAGFKLNNNYRSRYARLIHRQESDLDGFFSTRELRAV